MADLTGTNLVDGLWKTGEYFEVIGSYTYADTVTSGDTITFDNLLPEGDKTVVSFTHYGDDLDTHATPTGTIVWGDGTDADAFLTSKVCGGAAQQLNLNGDGASIGTSTTATTVKATVGGTIATAPTTGDVFVKVGYVCGNVAT